MIKIKFTISYDGTCYFGWQRQPNKHSVQEEIEKVLSKIFNEEIGIHGAGRTDRGVHAKGQVASATLPRRVALTKLLKSINSMLPRDILIFDLEEAQPNFHARFSAKGKIYSYHIYTKTLLDPFKRNTCYHHPYPLDLSLMKQAIPIFIGRKDFSSFANFLGKSTKAPSPIKTIYSITLEETTDGCILRFHGDGFLYKMVRNITGALLDIGGNHISISELETILEEKKNTHGLYQAPAHGLFLETVQYD